MWVGIESYMLSKKHPQGLNKNPIYHSLQRPPFLFQSLYAYYSTPFLFYFGTVSRKNNWNTIPRTNSTVKEIGENTKSRRLWSITGRLSPARMIIQYTCTRHLLIFHIKIYPIRKSGPTVIVNENSPRSYRSLWPLLLSWYTR